MVGDVNLFFNDPNDASTAEVDIMIAEPGCRGRGLGTEAVTLMMNYGIRVDGADASTCVCVCVCVCVRAYICACVYVCACTHVQNILCGT